MARFSDGSQVDYVSLATDRFSVWDLSTDPYDHLELAGNWDKLDGILGRPDDNSQWPPTIGVGGGIWKEIQNALDDVTSASLPIGAIIDWFYPATITSTILDYLDGLGWVVLDATTLIAAADHDFPGVATDFYTPNLANAFTVGAASGTARGTAGTVNTAPGLVSTTLSGNSGEAGSHSVAGHRHTVDDHYHSIAPHSHTVAQHIHSLPDHFHNLGGVTGQPAAGGGEQTRDGTGTRHTSAFSQHAHTLPASTGFVGVALSTSPGGPTSTGTTSMGATGVQSDTTYTSTSSTHDNRPRHVGLIKIMKVRNP